MWNTEFEGELYEYEGEGEGFEMGQEFESGFEMGQEFESGFEMGQELFGEMSGEFEGEMPLSEAQEMELAAELLSVTNEAELEQFLGGLISGAKKLFKSPVGRALGGVLKGVAKKALPMVGGALGSMVAPGIGTAIGSSLGSAAGNLFGLELEGLSNEDREFEVARRVVRLASSATRHAATAPAHVPPMTVARRSVAMAARRHAPGLLSQPAFAPRRVTRSPYMPYGPRRAAPVASGQPVRRGPYPSYPYPHHSWRRPAWTGYGPRPAAQAAPFAAAPTAPLSPMPAAAAQPPPAAVAQPAPAAGYGRSYYEPWGYDAAPGAAPVEAPSVYGQAGRWIRRGRNIIIFGA